MVQSKLIFMEGLPSTGKSTNSSILLSQFIRNGKKARWIHEVARPHPTLFFSEAVLDGEEYKNFLQIHPNSEFFINNIKTRRNNSIVVDLLELEWNYSDQLGDEFINNFKRFDVWNFPLEKYIKIALEKWKHFVENQCQQDEIIILDSSIFQFQIYTFILAGAPFSKLKTFVEALYEIASPLSPSLVYFYRENTEDTIDYLIHTRGISFLERIWERDRDQPYYQNRKNGAEGYKMFLRDYAKFAKSLFDSFPYQKCLLEITKGKWDEYVDHLMDFFNLTYINSPIVSFPNGIYFNDVLKKSLEIKNNYCITPDGGQKGIYPKSKTEFYFNDLPVILRYDEKSIIIDGEQLCDQWTTNGTIFKRID